MLELNSDSSIDAKPCTFKNFAKPVVSYFGNSLRFLCDLGVSAVSVFELFFTAETQRALRLRREKTRLGLHCQPTFFLRGRNFGGLGLIARRSAG